MNTFTVEMDGMRRFLLKKKRLLKPATRDYRNQRIIQEGKRKNMTGRNQFLFKHKVFSRCSVVYFMKQI